MKIEIFEEDGDNTLSFDEKYADFTIDVYPDTKTYQSRMCLKDDVYYRTEQFEYRIKTDPLKVEIRLTERVDEPPKRYCVKDGVVLESDILQESGAVMTSLTKKLIDGLKKEVEWHKDLVSDPVSMYILSKHPEIVNPEDYRRYLRQLSERIKNAMFKVKKALESDKMVLQVTDDEGGAHIVWCSKTKPGQMSEEETKNAIEYETKLQEQFFDEKSKEYVGISDGEFRSSAYILTNIETILNKKPASVKKELELKMSKTKGIVISLVLSLLISWLVSWLINISPFLIFGIVQVVAFAQSIIGGLLEKVFE